MKAILTVSMLAASLNVFAGYEDHIQNQSCYVLENGQEGSTSAVVPNEVCLETLDINLTINQILVYSYFQPELYKGMQVVGLSKHNEDRTMFSASNVLSNRTESGCGDLEKVELVLSGEVNGSGIGQVNQLQVSVNIESSNDVCHSQVQRTTLNYQLR